MSGPDSLGSGHVTPAGRLAEFEREASRLKVRAGGAGPERRLATVGAAVAAAGLIVTLVAFNGSGGAADPRDQTDFVILAVFGLGLVISGMAIWFRYSVTRYLRYWLIRLLYEAREQGDRLVGSVPNQGVTVDVRESDKGEAARSRAD